MTERLAELDRLKAEFVSLATHELKTPINVIGGYAELLDEGLYGELEPKQRDVVLALIQEQTRTLTRLVNQLLDLSRFEAGGVPIEARRWTWAPAPGGGGCVPGAGHPEAGPVPRGAGCRPARPVVLDPERIRHEVLGNLLSNAFKFTPTGGEVRVRAWGEGGVSTWRYGHGRGHPAGPDPAHLRQVLPGGRGSQVQGSGAGPGHREARHRGSRRRGHRHQQCGEGTRFHIVLPSQRRARVNRTWDAVIVGGGPGGLAPAYWLARYRRRTFWSWTTPGPATRTRGPCTDIPGCRTSARRIFGAGCRTRPPRPARCRAAARGPDPGEKGAFQVEDGAGAAEAARAG
jgi:hypothetical protein